MSAIFFPLLLLHLLKDTTVPLSFPPLVPFELLFVSLSVDLSQTITTCTKTNMCTNKLLVFVTQNFNVIPTQAKHCGLYIKTDMTKDKHTGITNNQRTCIICHEFLKGLGAMELLLTGKILSHTDTIASLAPSHFPGPFSLYWNGSRGPKKHCQAKDGSENTILPEK